jgi:hypothetical protein
MKTSNSETLTAWTDPMSRNTRIDQRADRRLELPLRVLIVNWLWSFFAR